MTYLEASRIAFWTFVVVLAVGLAIWVALIEKHDRRQEALAEEHRRRRRIERFKNLNR
jgi:heme exporter protein D